MPRLPVTAFLAALSLTGCAQILVSPEPSLEGASPGLVCNEQLTNVLTVTGDGLAPLPSDVLQDEPVLILPALSITLSAGLDGSASTGAAVDLAQVSRWIDDGTMAVTLAPEMAIDEGVYDLAVSNPDGQVASTSQAIAMAPPPVAAGFDPELACLDQSDVSATLTGEGFLVVGGALPQVSVGALTLTPDAADGCFALAGPVEAESCETLALTLPQGALDEGVHDVTVTNPSPAECVSVEDVQLELYAAPTLSSVDQDMTCNDQHDTALTLTGEGFLVIEGELPTVAVGSWSGLADAAADCTVVGSAVAVQECATLTVTIPAGSLEPGYLAVSVTNPARVGCTTTEEVGIEVVGAPVVTDLDPASSCYAAPEFSLDVNGQSFLVLADGTMPTVFIGGGSFIPTTASGCTALTGPAGGETCTTLTVNVPEGTWTTADTHATLVINPEPADCESNSDVLFAITAPPQIAGVEPAAICDSGEAFTVTGTGFVETPSVTVGDTPAASVTFIDESTLEVTLPADIGAGLYDVTVTNPDGCSDTAEAAIELLPEPLVLFVDPTVTYTGIAVRGTVYVSGVNEDVLDVWIEDASTGTAQSLDFAWSSTDPDEILATIPSGLAEDSYDLYIEDAVGCQPGLEDAFSVEADLTVEIASVDPAFAYTGDYTAVEVYAADPVSDGYAQFEDTPRVYLTPSASSGSTTATELYGVTFQDEALLDAIVPSGLETGDYDLLVVNPDGQVGLLSEAIEVMEDPPPEIDSLSPGSVDTQDDYDVTIYGSNLDAASVDFECEDKSTGSTFTSAGTITSSSSDEVVVTIESASDDSFTNGVVCVVVLTNVDGASVSYSSLSVTNPSANLYSIEVGNEMTTARRAPAAVALRATASSRYLYAIGGDDGSTSGAFDTIERVKVGKYGDLEDWEELPDTLDSPRTLAGVATVGRYVYLVGGNDGTGAVDTLLRATVLDPLEAPRIEDVEVELSEGPDGLAGGTWSYRVAALFDSSYDDNPGGESLASDPFVLRLPDLSVGLYVTLSWEVVSGASGYRVYRSPVADAGSASEEWIADVSGGDNTSYQDLGDVSDADLAPLPKGALGQWASLDAMSTAREGACVGVGVDPSDDSNWYLYVAGGRDASGTVLDSIEWFDITVVDEHDHEGGAWTTSAYDLATARWLCGSFSISAELHSYVPAGETWVYFGSGLDSSGKVDNTLEALLVASGGDFEDYYAVDDMRSRAGYAVGAASNQLYAFGGASGDPDDSTDSAQICTDGMGGCSRGAPDPPDLKNWNALGLSLNEARYLPGSAQESSVFFIVGGQTDTEDATTTVDWANY